MIKSGMRFGIIPRFDLPDPTNEDEDETTACNFFCCGSGYVNDNDDISHPPIKGKRAHIEMI